jgi:hypothetical protein
VSRVKGSPASESQKAAGRANLAKGQQKRREALAKGGEGAASRWAKLIDGSLTVGDLDDEEVARMKVRGKGGQFPKPRAIPSHLVQQFQSEQLKRAKGLLHKDLRKGAEVMGKIIDDPEASWEIKFKAAVELMNRGLGKTPETVQFKTVDVWGDTLAEGADIKDIRDLSDLMPEDPHE